jgi:hypothetical protein
VAPLSFSPSNRSLRANRRPGRRRGPRVA